MLEHNILNLVICTYTIENVLVDYNEPLSLIKLLIIVFNEKNIKSKRRATGNLINKYIYNINGKFEDFLRELDYIFAALNILMDLENIKLEEGAVEIKKINFDIYKKDKYYNKVLREIKNISDQQIIKELLQCI